MARGEKEYRKGVNDREFWIFICRNDMACHAVCSKSYLDKKQAAGL